MFKRELPPSQRGKHRKTLSLLMDEDVEQACSQFLKTCEQKERNPKGLKKFVLENFGDRKQTISDRTIRNWMYKLNYKYGFFKKDVYVDGHEREDVVAYRNVFLQRMLPSFNRMSTYMHNEDGTTVIIPPVNPYETELIWICHDESTYYSNDDGGIIWYDKSNPHLRKKGNGASIMVSDFICPCHGRLYFINDQDEKKYIAEYIKPGKNRDGYWQTPHMLKQLEEKTIRAHKQMHPGKIGLFMFDNSTNHSCRPDDDLNVDHMGRHDGGITAKWLKDTTYVKDGVTYEQKMYVEIVNADGSITRKQKGVEKVLKERGLYESVQDKKKHRCNKKTKSNPHPQKIRKVIGKTYNCCCYHTLMCQPDFMSGKSKIELLVEEQGDQAIFLPKFHCEINPIEKLWGFSKRYCRANCDYNFKSLENMVPISLSSCSVTTIQKYFRNATNIIHMYSYGHSVELAQFVTKQYKSHRPIPPAKLQEIIDEFNTNK
eukprot:Pgem_evm2s15317